MDVCSTLNSRLLCWFSVRILPIFLLLASCATAPQPVPPPLVNPILWEHGTTIPGTGIPQAKVHIWDKRLPIANDTISAEGTFEVTVPALVEGQVLTATQTINGQMSNRSVPVSVKKVRLSEINIASAVSTTIEQGQPFTYTARGLFSNGKTEEPLSEVTWSTSQPTVATINPNGVVTGLEAGVTSIQAMREGIHSASAQLTVKPQAPIVTSTLTAGDTRVTGMAAPSASIKLMINGIPLDRRVLADDEGQWQVDNLIPLNEQDHITSSQLVKHIESADSDPVVVAPAVLTQITLAPAPTSVLPLELGQTQRFTAFGLFSNGRQEPLISKITWSTSQPTVATIDPNGVVTGLEAGVTSIQAMREGIHSASAQLTVKPQAPIVTSTLTAGDTRVTGMAAPSASIKLMVNGIPLDRRVLADDEGQWQVDNLIPLNEQDHITSSQLVKHIESADSDPVVVAPAVLTQITLTPDSTTVRPLELGQSRHFTATGLFSNGRAETPLPKVTWAIDQPAVATVDANGVVTGREAGTTTVHAIMKGVQSDPVHLTVKPRPPVVISPLKAGDTIVSGSADSLAHIQVFKNGIPLDTQILADEEGQWQASNLSPLREHDQISSTQTVNSAQSETATAIDVLPNDSPTLEPIGDHHVVVGETLTIVLHATDPEGEALSFQVIERPLPNNSRLDEKTGTFTFTPTAEQIGKATLTLLVSDGNSSQQETFTIKITLPKSLVVLLENPDGTVGSIEVANPTSSQVLDKAGQAISLGSADTPLSQPFMLKEEDVLETFKDALEANPEKPMEFLLYFEEKTKLTPESEQQLQEILSFIEGRVNPDVSIIGHSDRAGSDELNYQVSLNRANAIRDALVAGGIDPQHMEVTSHGENNPVVKTPDGVKEPLNRRVEVIIR